MMHFRDQFQPGTIAQNGIDDRPILFWLDAARGIDQPAAGNEVLARRSHEPGLEDRKFHEVFGTQSPADLRALAEHARIRAGDVQQNAVELFAGKIDGVTGEHAGFDDGNTHPAARFLDPP